MDAVLANEKGRSRISDRERGELCLTIEGYDTAPQALGAPDSGAQALQLHDLAVIDKEFTPAP